MAEQTQLKEAPKDSIEVELGPSAGQTKVELDLDDAPFLRTEESRPPATAASAPAVAQDASATDNDRRARKKKLLLMGGAALCVLLLVAVWWFFLRTPPPPPSEPPKPEVIVVPSAVVPQGPEEFIKEFTPFLVPHVDAGGVTRFLICKFSVLSTESQTVPELERHMVPLRDAVYFYLRSKDSAWLMDVRNGAAIKKDMVAILNDYLARGEVEDVLFESYLNE
ncbi:MAG: flagellar basal body-associated FliL family protein [Desulfovibrio sp.]|nr:flagellar basal body-associated FliL family protein [Desulfovibrio sp.]